jgi:hypothetical protein
LASWTGEAGDAASALVQCQGLLAIRERTSGPEHPDTVAARQDVAHWTGMADAGRARDEYAALVPLAIRVLGSKHPRTVAIRRDLAVWTEKAGEIGKY